ncbi:hypothetical protein BT63DRAFT_418573 [Microthyrium microscopicum]|uniref:Uncharacterized protein n=1 Tax=Microthyrium microscopicum TaxID=703497 RepID=A0A6A6TV04_9PEZI|nr:hypothetical protein BT63DRAFT_418573 [Microthyrium microscopicum]
MCRVGLDILPCRCVVVLLPGATQIACDKGVLPCSQVHALGDQKAPVNWCAHVNPRVNDPLRDRTRNNGAKLLISKAPSKLGYSLWLCFEGCTATTGHYSQFPSRLNQADRKVAVGCVLYLIEQGQVLQSMGVSRQDSFRYHPGFANEKNSCIARFKSWHNAYVDKLRKNKTTLFPPIAGMPPLRVHRVPKVHCSQKRGTLMRRFEEFGWDTPIHE